MPGMVRVLQGGVTPIGTFSSLREALDEAQSGDHLVLSEGIFSGPDNRDLLVQDDVTIRGLHGPATSIIDCEGSGRAFSIDGANVLLAGLTIRNGIADRGGALQITGSSVDIRACAFEDNAATTGFSSGGAISSFSSSLSLTDSLFLGNVAANTGGAISTDAVQADGCLFLGNSASTWGGAINIEVSFSVNSIVDCRFEANESDDGGAVFVVLLGALEVDRCLFVGNVAREQSGAVSMATAPGVELHMSNSILFRNRAARVGGVSAQFGTITNCTIVENVATTNSPGGAFVGSATAGMTLTNCILRDNVSLASSVLEQQLQAPLNPFSGAAYRLEHSNVAGAGALPTNIDVDPLFVNQAEGDLHLQPGSPCIDVGLVLPQSANQLDYDGDPRVLGSGIDIGADEVLQAR